MVQQPFDYIVSPPPGQTFTSALTAACRGNANLANLLNYFLYEASREVKRQNVNLENVDLQFVEVKRSLDDIVRGLANHNKSASKKTIAARIVKLQSYDLLIADSYHQRYLIAFRAIQSAMMNPPEPEKPRLRGIHARQSAQSEECKSSLKGKSTFFSDSTEELAKKVTELEQENVNLHSQIVNLHSQIVNLHSSLDDERACRAALEAKFDALYSNVIQLSNTDITLHTSSANASAKEKQIEKSKRTPKQPTLLETPKKEPVILSPEEQAFYDLWVTFHDGFKPTITDTLKKRCGQLAPVIHTLDELKALYDFTKKQPFMSGKGVELGNLVSCYPKWKSTLAAATTPEAEPPRPSALVSKPQEIKNKLRMFRFSLEKRIAENKPEEADKLRVTIARLEAQLAEIEPALAIAV